MNSDTATAKNDKLAPGDKFARITHLPKDKRDRVDEMLRSGFAPARIAKMMQEEWKESDDISNIGLAQTVRRYQEHFIPSGQIIAGASPKSLSRYLDEVEQNCDLLQVLWYAVSTTVERMEMAKTRERDSKWPTYIGNQINQMLNKLVVDSLGMGVKAGVLNRLITMAEDKARDARRSPSLENPDTAIAIADAAKKLLVQMDSVDADYVEVKNEPGAQ